MTTLGRKTLKLWDLGTLQLKTKKSPHHRRLFHFKLENGNETIIIYQL